MRKSFYVLILALSLAFVAGSNAQEFKAWNLDEMIHPDLKQSFLKSPRVDITPENLEEVRQSFASFARPHEDPAVEIHNEIIGGNMRVQVYKPAGVKTKLPGVLWIHGGGHITGNPDSDDELFIYIVKRANCILAAPDYRLAPEFPYPADLDDCMTALRWLADNPEVNADKIAVAGLSAGGGLTVAVTLKARDEGGPAICFQMPLYPMLDHRNITPSSYQITDKRAWCRDFNITAWKMYLGGREPDIYTSPALAQDLSNLPPAYIMVGTLDPFRDETLTYAQRLMQAEVPVELHVVPGGTHAFEIVFPDAPISIKAREEYINALADALN
ncbi:MAG: alpha/beta hydrolase [Synergistaceae bacterium]|nr:alpha/beta hydrolase [Synergistaceae bacterium]